MSWGKVDDRLHSHPKWRRASKGARALWTTALSWCSSFPSDGIVPRHMLAVLDGTAAEARALVDAGLWLTCDEGWRFHQWEERNPDAVSQKALMTDQRSGGKFGSHQRWHVKRHLKVEGCEFCDPKGAENG